METLLTFQHWLYTAVGQGLTDVAQGNARAVFVAMAAAVLFGALHALMPGHGKTVLISYHLGQPAGIKESMLNGAILALTHVGLAVILVLAGFTVISRAFAYGGRTPQFETASGVLIALIGAFLLWRSIRHDPVDRCLRQGRLPHDLGHCLSGLPQLRICLMASAMRRGLRPKRVPRSRAFLMPSN